MQVELLGNINNFKIMNLLEIIRFRVEIEQMV